MAAFHEGHFHLFLNALKRTDQVIFYVKNVHNLGDNPFTFKNVKKELILNYQRCLKIDMC